MIAAEKKAITEAVKIGREVARAGAPQKTGKGKRGISYKTRTRGGVVEGRVYNKVFYMRFQARGTGGRFTRKGAYRGVLPEIPFMSHAAQKVDPLVPKLVEKHIKDALRVSGLL